MYNNKCVQCSCVFFGVDVLAIYWTWAKYYKSYNQQHVCLSNSWKFVKVFLLRRAAETVFIEWKILYTTLENLSKKSNRFCSNVCRFWKVKGVSFKWWSVFMSTFQVELLHHTSFDQQLKLFSRIVIEYVACFLQSLDSNLFFVYRIVASIWQKKCAINDHIMLHKLLFWNYMDHTIASTCTISFELCLLYVQTSFWSFSKYKAKIY